MRHRFLEFLYEIRLLQSLFFVGTVYLSLLFIGRRWWVGAALAFAAGVLWLLYIPSIAWIIGNLGMDSINEARNFDIREAWFWISTIVSAIKPLSGTSFLLLLYLVIAAVTWYLSGRILTSAMFRKYRSRIQTAIALLLMSASLVVVFKDSVILFVRNSNELEQAGKNFDSPVPALSSSGERVDVVVYIGESLSVFDMGVYGYPRDTTPNLSRMAREDRNLVVFHNVFSTHTHTSQSLLEALSFSASSRDMFLPIIHRKRYSLPTVLSKAGVHTRLFSNQGMSGTWNEASVIIFRNAEKKFSVDTRLLGNNEDILKKPWDDEFLMSQLAASDEHGPSDMSTVTFLHAYAGHGPYLDNIPERFRKPVDTWFSINASRQVTESGIYRTDQIEAYDSAIRYVDFTLSRVIGHIRTLKKPTVLLVFSDHGESVFTGRGHDSSRFIHEMARVPFILYFNDAAIERYPEMYRRYRALALTRQTATLAQLSPVISDLVGVRPANGTSTTLGFGPLVGEACQLPPIVVREVGGGLTYVNLNKTPPVIPEKFGYRITDVTGPATTQYVQTRGMPFNPACVDPRSPLSFEVERRNQLVHGR